MAVKICQEMRILRVVSYVLKGVDIPEIICVCGKHQLFVALCMKTLSSLN